MNRLSFRKKHLPPIESFSFIELKERLRLSRGFVVTIQSSRRSFHFDHNGPSRLQNKTPLEIDLEVAQDHLEATRELLVESGVGANWMEAK